MPQENYSDVKAIIDTATGLSNMEPIKGPDQDVVAVSIPKDKKVVSLKSYYNQFLEKPERREGQIETHDIASFIEVVNGYKNDSSVIFANNKLTGLAQLTAHFDYHEQGKDGAADWNEFQCIYPLTHDAKWKTWLSQPPEGLKQEEFAFYIESNLTDVMTPEMLPEPKEAYNPELLPNMSADKKLAHYVKLLNGKIATPSELLEFSRGFTLTRQETVGTAYNTNSGEINVTITSENENERNITVPNLVLIAIPIYEGGDYYRILVRLRYRSINSQIRWFIEVVNPAEVEQDALKGICDTISDETEIQVRQGKINPSTCMSKSERWNQDEN